MTGCWNIARNQIEFRSMIFQYFSNTSLSKLQQDSHINVEYNAFERLEKDGLGK